MFKRGLAGPTKEEILKIKTISNLSPQEPLQAHTKIFQKTNLGSMNIFWDSASQSGMYEEGLSKYFEYVLC